MFDCTARRWFFYGGTILSTLAAAPAAAQSVDRTIADVAEAQAVETRWAAAHAPLDITFGASEVQLSVGGKIVYDDNVYNTEGQAKADVEGLITPHARWQVKAGSVALALTGDARVERYAQLTAENTVQYDIAGQAQWQPHPNIGITVDGFVGRHREMRGTLGDVVVGAPNRYDIYGGTGTLSARVGAVELTGVGGVTVLDYLPVELGGVAISQDIRSRTITTGSASVSVPVSPGLRAVLRGDYNDQAYRVDTGQNSHGYAVTLGLASAVDELISGKVGFGYLRQVYDNPTLAPVQGFTYDARITWNPSPFLTATLSGGRTIQQSPGFSQGGVLEDNVTLRLDYWPLHNLIVSLDGGYVADDFRGISRSDQRFTVDLGARYALSRVVELSFQYGHRDQASEGLFARRYAGNTLLFGVTLRR